MTCKSIITTYHFFHNRTAEFPKTPSPKPARLPPQTTPAGGESVEAGQIQNPRKIVCPAESVLFPFHSLGFSAKWVLTFSNKHHHCRRDIQDAGVRFSQGPPLPSGHPGCRSSILPRSTTAVGTSGMREPPDHHLFLL